MMNLEQITELTLLSIPDELFNDEINFNLYHDVATGTPVIVDGNETLPDIDRTTYRASVYEYKDESNRSEEDLSLLKVYLKGVLVSPKLFTPEINLTTPLKAEFLTGYLQNLGVKDFRLLSTVDSRSQQFIEKRGQLFTGMMMLTNT